MKNGGPLFLSGRKEEAAWAKSGRSTPKSLPKAQKKPRRLLASSGLQTMKGCQQITNRGLSSIHRSRPRELKRLSKPRVPSELKATASSSCSRVGGALFVLSLGK
jgi:hypothetical protein